MPAAQQSTDPSIDWDDFVALAGALAAAHPGQNLFALDDDTLIAMVEALGVLSPGAAPPDATALRAIRTRWMMVAEAGPDYDGRDDAHE